MPIFRSDHQAELLAWLLLHPDEEYTITDLAKRTGTPVPTMHREVQRLLDAGLIRARTVGRSRLLASNPENRATAPLTELLEITFGPPAVIAEEFAAVPGAEQVILFGSWAERYHGVPGRPPNDVDVLVIGTAKREEVYDAADRAQARLGMEVNPVLRAAEQWEQESDPLIAQVKSSSWVSLVNGEEGWR
jgi:DNA-binding transcriptional ArsR family regulator